MTIDISGAVSEKVDRIRAILESKKSAASNELLGVAREVLSGARNGRVYTHPIHYTASAPGEPPAVRTGALRGSWQTAEGSGLSPAIKSGIPYASTVNGTRPYVDLIKTKALPRVKRIYKSL